MHALNQLFYAISYKYIDDFYGVVHNNFDSNFDYSHRHHHVWCSAVTNSKNALCPAGHLSPDS